MKITTRRFILSGLALAVLQAIQLTHTRGAYATARTAGATNPTVASQGAAEGRADDSSQSDRKKSSGEKGDKQKQREEGATRAQTPYGGGGGGGEPIGVPAAGRPLPGRPTGGRPASRPNTRPSARPDLAVPRTTDGRFSWGKGSFDSPKDSLIFHYERHGPEVGAKNAMDYLRKSTRFADRVTRGGTDPKAVPGKTTKVKRHVSGDSYVDLKGREIISYGKTKNAPKQPDAGTGGPQP